jgi:hypothetical protein
VSELADLAEVFNPDIQVCSWRREIDPAIGSYLSGLKHARELQVIETVSPVAQPRLESLPAGLGRSSFMEDLALLSEIVCELLGSPEVGLRLARVGHAMCPGWHLDRVGIRLACTYQGPGTEWLGNQNVKRHDLHSEQLNDGTVNQAAPGEIALLKGALWQGNDKLGAVHRSPELAPDALLRTVVTLDPLWRE